MVLTIILQCVLRASAADIVLVKSSDAEPYAQAEAALHDRLIEQNHTVRVMLARDVSGKGVTASLGKVDAVVAIGTPAAKWLHKQLPESTRLVYCMVTNAEDAGLLQGRASFGATTEVAAVDQLNLIAEALPRARIIGVLYRSDTPEGKTQLQVLRAATADKWQIEALAVNDHPSISAAIDALIHRHIDVIWTTADQKVYDTASVRALLLAGLRSKIPVWGFSPSFVRAGALIGVGVEPSAQGAQAAEILLKLIENPAGPKERAQPPQKFQIAVNLIVAEQLLIEIPESLSRRATFIYRPEK